MIKHIFLLLFLMSFSFSNDSVNNSKQKVIVGAFLDNPPALFTENGVTKGHMTEILPALGEIAGLEFELREMSKPSALTALSRGLVDMVPCLIITEERKKIMDFSRHYEWGFLVIVYRKGNIFPDLNSLVGKRVASVTGSAEERLIDEKNEEMSLDLDIHRYERESIVIQSLRSGKVDAVLMPYDEFVTINDNDLAASVLEFRYEAAFGFGKNRNDDLIERINKGITILKDNGKLDKIRSKWYHYKADK